jgi:hypothetical protein
VIFLLFIASKNSRQKQLVVARQWWFTSVILATQEAEIRRIVVQSHPGQIVSETLS